MCQQCVKLANLPHSIRRLTPLTSQCYADGGNSTRGNSPNAGVVERQSIAERSVRALRGAKAIDSGAARRMEMKTLKMLPRAHVVVQMAAMVAVACAGESD
jgi:hypothetical protein